MKRFSTKGFTLIELMVVIAIMGVLFTIVFGALDSARVKTRDNKRVSDLKEIQYALLQYFDTFNKYPTTITPSVDTPNPLAPFLDTIPTDPSTNAPYDYASPDSSHFCIGAVFENAADINAVTDNAGCDAGNSSDTYTLSGSTSST